MRQADWYFDFVSPYAYLSLQRLPGVQAGVRMTLRPVFLGGLLLHWGQKAPAELPTKRLWTYRHCVWKAGQTGMPLRFPASHPFNSLPYLRLSAAAGNGPSVIQRIFEVLWTTGVDPADPAVLGGLAAEFGVAAEAGAAPEVKDAVRLATDHAIAAGVFGVPTVVMDGQLFWGDDGLAFFDAFLHEPGVLAGTEMRRLESLPVGVQRKPG